MPLQIVRTTYKWSDEWSAQGMHSPEDAWRGGENWMKIWLYLFKTQCVARAQP